MAVWYIKLGAVIIALIVMGLSAGFSIALPGYSRRRILAGESAHDQMVTRESIGKWVVFHSKLVGAIVIALYVALGFAIPNGEPEYSVPESIEILHSLDQGIAIFIIDGELTVKSHDEVPYYMDKDHLFVFYTHSVGLFGFHTSSSKELHILIEPELDDNIVVGDSFKEWED